MCSFDKNNNKNDKWNFVNTDVILYVYEYKQLMFLSSYNHKRKQFYATRYKVTTIFKYFYLYYLYLNKILIYHLFGKIIMMIQKKF